MTTARSIVVVSVLALMLGALAAHLVLRPVAPALGPRHRPAALPAVTTVDAGVAPEPTARDAASRPEPASNEESADASAGPPPTATEPSPRQTDRPLRVIALGWEAAAPALLGNGGTASVEGSNFASKGLALEVRVATTLEEIEAALARGGGDGAGADVAALPLTGLVVTAGRLAALEPRAFLVTGWSVGRETLLASAPELLSDPAGTVALVAEPESTATFFAAFALELMGVPPRSLRLVSPAAAEAAEAPFAAVHEPSGPPQTRAGTPRRHEVVSTLEASRLLPIVLVAPAREIDAQREALVGLARGWLEEAARVRADIPSAARRLAAFDGAPEPLESLGRLERLEVPSLEENAALLGLAGRRAATLEALARQAGEIDVALGLLRRAPAAAALVEPEVVAALVRRGEAGRLGGGLGSQGRPAGAEGRSPAVVVRASLAGLDRASAAYAVAFLAEVFAGARLRVEATPAEASAILEAVSDRFGVERERLETASRPATAQATAAVEVLGP